MNTGVGCHVLPGDPPDQGIKTQTSRWGFTSVFMYNFFFFPLLLLPSSFPSFFQLLPITTGLVILVYTYLLCLYKFGEV